MDDMKGKYWLEDSDLDILRLHTSKQRDDGNVKPIWSLNNWNLRNKEYYEFEVLAERTGLEAEMNVGFNDVSNQTCHICNLNIPKTFLKQHNKSFKHITCMKIADQALERIKKQMSQDVEDLPKTKTTASYFCDPCAVVVRVSDKTDHITSEPHLNSLAHDKLLNDLLLTYLNKDNVLIKIDKSTMTTTAKVEQENDQTSKTMPLLNSDILICNTLSLQPSGMYYCNACNIHIIDRTVLYHVNKNSHKYNLTLPKSNTNTNTSFKVEEQKTTAKNYSISYLMENIGENNELLCKVCEVRVPTNIDPSGHVRGSEHVCNYKTLLASNQLTERGGKYFCACCLKYVDSTIVIDHINSLTHSNSLLKATENTTTEVKLKQNSLYSKVVVKAESNSINTEELAKFEANGTNSKAIAKLEINSVNSPTLAQTICTSNNVNLKNAISGESSSVTKRNEGSQSNTDSEDEDDDSVWHICNICNVFLVNNDSILKSHYEGESHKSHLEATFTTKTNKTPISASRAASTSASQVITEIKPKFKSKIEKPKKQNDKSDRQALGNETESHYLMEKTPNSSQLRCKLCNIIVGDKTKCVTDHMESLKHISKYKQMLNSNSLQKHVDHLYNCEVRKECVTEGKEFDHINNSNHMININLAHRKLVSRQVCIELTDNLQLVKCKACQVMIPNSNSNIKEHIQGLKHNFNYNSVFDANGFKRNDDRIYCEVCCVFVKEVDVFRHIDDDVHKLKITMLNVLCFQLTEYIQGVQLNSNYN